MEVIVKGLIMGVLVLSLIVGETEGGGCCLTDEQNNCYYKCHRFSIIRVDCCKTCGGLYVSGNKCPSSYSNAIFRNIDMIMSGTTTTATSTTDYCILGCSSSVCDAITSSFKINTSAGEGGSNEVKEAVEHCHNACTLLCNNKQAGSLKG